MPPPDLAGLFGCPHCHFAFSPRAAFMTLDYCPRCLARRRVAQRLRSIDAMNAVRVDPLVGDELRDTPLPVASEAAAQGAALAS